MTKQLEFTIGGPPVSQQTRNRERVKHWIHTVQDAIEQYWDRDEAIYEPVEITIACFLTDLSIDVDNIPKPILDALKGRVIFDDSQVVALHCSKEELKGRIQVSHPSPILNEALARCEPFLYITVNVARNQTMLVQ